MNKFEISDQLFEEMRKEATPPTPEEIATRPPVSDDGFEFAEGDKDEKIHNRASRPRV